MSKIPTTEQSEVVPPVPADAEDEVAQPSTAEVSRIRVGVPLRDISGASDPTIKNK